MGIGIAIAVAGALFVGGVVGYQVCEAEHPEVEVTSRVRPPVPDSNREDQATTPPSEDESAEASGQNVSPVEDESQTEDVEVAIVWTADMTPNTEEAQRVNLDPNNLPTTSDGTPIGVYLWDRDPNDGMFNLIVESSLTPFELKWVSPEGEECSIPSDVLLTCDDGLENVEFLITEDTVPPETITVCLASGAEEGP